MSNESGIKVFIPTEQFWPEFAGWIQQTLKIARGTADEENIQFVSISRPPETPETEAQVPLPSNVSIKRIGPAVSNRTLRAQVLFVLLAVVELFKQGREIDVLFMPFVFFPGFVFLLVGRLSGIPTVARISGQEVSPNRSLAAQLRFLTLRGVNAVVALNEKDAGRLRDIGVLENRIYLIPNGVDTSRFQPVVANDRRVAKRELGLPEDRYVVSFIGLFCERKGVVELVEAYSRVVASRGTPDSHLVLAGPSDESVREVEPNYVEKAERSIDKLGGQVRVTGAIDYVPALLRASDVFVLPSYAEGMPNVLLEAMSNGLPCLATRIPGIQDLIDNEREGLLVDPVDIDELEKKLSRLIDDSALRERLGDAARRRIESGYSIAYTARQYVQLFQKLCS